MIMFHPPSGRQEDNVTYIEGVIARLAIIVIVMGFLLYVIIHLAILSIFVIASIYSFSIWYIAWWIISHLIWDIVAVIVYWMFKKVLGVVLWLLTGK